MKILLAVILLSLLSLNCYAVDKSHLEEFETYNFTWYNDPIQEVIDRVEV